MESSRSKKSGNKDKHKKSKSKHKQSKETKAKAKAFALGVYTSLPAEGTFVPDAISKSPQMKQLPKEKKIDCACGVPEHPKMADEAAAKRKQHPVPDRLSLTNGSLDSMNRDVYGNSNPSPRADPARSASIGGPVYAGFNTPPASPHASSTSAATTAPRSPVLTAQSEGAVYGSFSSPILSPLPSSATNMGVVTAPGAVEHTSEAAKQPADDHAVVRASSATLLPTGAGLFRTGSLKATPSPTADRYNSFMKPVLPTQSIVLTSDTTLAFAQETDTYTTQETEHGVPATPAELPAKPDPADSGSDISEDDTASSDDSAKNDQTPRYVFWEDKPEQRRVEGLLWKLEQRLKNLEGSNIKPNDKKKAYSLITCDEYIYNSRFQEIMEDSSMNKFDNLSSLGSDFVKLAETYARIIISEKCLPVDQKSIKPVDIGGAAGGEKFLVNGILFKYALDAQIATFEDGSPRYMYGGATKDDAAAMKAANNELLGLSQALKCNIPGLFFPLMAIIDYVGYRLVAVSTLPINKKTIVYGSADAGRTVHNSDPVAANIMQQLGKTLNLREHLVFDQKIIGAGDVEVHKAEDGRYYMVDFARLLPPEALREGDNPQNIFHRLLRPELVRQYRKPLSSDAFSGWQSADPNSQEYNADVIGASELLYDIIENQYPKKFMSPLFQLYFQNEICNICDLHRHGINMRHLGYVRRSMLAHTSKNSVMYVSEMVSRVLKNRLFQRYRDLMDRLKIFAEEPFKLEFVEMLNIITCPSRFPDFWKREVKELIIKKFGSVALTEEEKAPDYDLMKSSSQVFLLFRMQYMLGCVLPTSVDEDARAAVEEGREFEFTVSDLLEDSAYRPRIKYMPIIDFASGVSMYLQALRGSDNASRASSNIRLLMNARKKLLSAYNRLTDFAACRFFLAKIYNLIQLNRHSPKDADDLGRAVALLRYVRSDQPDNLDVALDMAVSAALLVILGTEKEKEHEDEYVELAKESYTVLSRHSEELHDSVVGEVAQWINNLQKTRSRSIPIETLSSYKSKAQTVMKQVLNPKHFSAFAQEIAAF